MFLRPSYISIFGILRRNLRVKDWISDLQERWQYGALMERSAKVRVQASTGQPVSPSFLLAQWGRQKSFFFTYTLF